MKKVVLILMVLFIVSCKKDKLPPSEPLGKVEIVLEHFWETDALPFVLGNAYVNTDTGDSLSISLVKYYLSNIALQRADGTWWKAPESYYLIDVSNVESTTLKVANIPSGDYIGMSFMIGVDSARNVSGAQTGALSPSNAMFWSWSTGYIMMKCEGNSPQAPTDLFVFHIGGFEGPNNTVWNREFTFGSQDLTIEEGGNPKITFNVFVDQVWESIDGLSQIQFVHTPGQPAPLITKGFIEGMEWVSIVE